MPSLSQLVRNVKSQLHILILVKINTGYNTVPEKLTVNPL